MNIPLEVILARLADEEWKRIRRHWNKQFMTYGPGPEWDKIKEDSVYKKDQETIVHLREFLGLKFEGDD